MIYKEEVLNNITDMDCDATFKAVPANPVMYQLLVINIGSGNYVSIFIIVHF